MRAVVIVCVYSDVPALGDKDVFVIETESDHCQIWAEAEETVEYRAYSTI
jgi:hypothetical protein